MPRSAITFLLGLLCLGSSASMLTACEPGERIELLLEAKGPNAATDPVMERARETIERRIAALGASGARVVRQGPDRLLVTLGRPGDAEQVKALIARSGRIEFRLVDVRADPAQVRVGRAPPGTEILPMVGGPEGGIPVDRRPIVTGAAIADAQAFVDAGGKAMVMIRFDATGSRRFAQATRENVGRPFAIVLDGTVVSAPLITEPILGGQAQINGVSTPEEAERLAIALRSGPLPVDLALVEERVARK